MASKYPLEKEEIGQGSPSDFGYLSGFHEEDECIPENQIVPESGFDGLKRSYSKCKKHPNHVDFYRPSDITMEALPDDLKSEENLSLIKNKIKLTVKVIVKYTSKKRPDCFFDEKVSYPYAELRGEHECRCGTGTINRILSTEAIKKSCPCHICVTPGEHAVNEYFKLTIRTATHLVFDDDEAMAAIVEYGYDVDRRGNNIKTLYGICVDGSKTSYSDMYRSDVCDFVVVTHDKQIANDIIDMVASTKLPVGVPHMYTYALPPEGVIVSHPHGCSKRITFGNVLFVVVPVIPKYETGKAMPLPSPTKCRLNPQLLNSVQGSKEMSETSSCLQDYVSMVENIIKMTEEDNTRPVNYLHSILNSLSSTGPGKPIPENSASSRSHAGSLSSVSPSMQSTSSEDIDTSETSENSADIHSQGRVFGHLTTVQNNSDKFDIKASGALETSAHSQRQHQAESPVTENVQMNSSGTSLMDSSPTSGTYVSLSVSETVQSTSSRIEASSILGNSENSNLQGEDMTSQGQNMPNMSSEASVFAACSQLFDTMATSPQFSAPSEFGHMYNDPRVVLDFVSNPRNQINSNLSSGMMQLVNACIPASQSEFQSSREYHDGDSITNANLSDRMAAFANFVTSTCEMMGIERKMIEGVAGVIKTKMPDIFDDGLRVDQEQEVWQDMLANVFKVAEDCSANNNDIGSVEDVVVRSGGNGAGATAGGGDTAGGNDAGDTARGNAAGDTASGNDSGETAGGFCKDDDYDDDDNCRNIYAVQEGDKHKREYTDGDGKQSDTDADVSIHKATRCVATIEDNVDKCAVNQDKNITTGDCNDPEIAVQKILTPETDLAATALSDTDGKKTEVRRKIVVAAQNGVQKLLKECHSNQRNIVQDILSVDTEAVENIYKSYKPSSDDLNSENDFTLPFAMNFILPSNAPFAMRYTKGTPGWYTFPKGTQLSTNNGRSIPIVPGTEFKSSTFVPQFSKVIHNIPTCCGSSGATIYSGLVGNDMLTYFPHLGSGLYQGKNASMSGVQENKLAGSSTAVWESMNRAMMTHVTRKMKETVNELELD